MRRSPPLFYTLHPGRSHLTATTVRKSPSHTPPPQPHCFEAVVHIPTLLGFHTSLPTPKAVWVALGTGGKVGGRPKMAYGFIDKIAWLLLLYSMPRPLVELR